MLLSTRRRVAVSMAHWLAEGSIYCCNQLRSCRVVDVHVLHAQLTRVGKAQPVQQSAQRCDAERSRMEGAVQIPDSQTMGGRIEVRLRRPRASERIEVRHQMPPLPPCLDQPRHRGLLHRIGVD